VCQLDISQLESCKRIWPALPGCQKSQQKQQLQQQKDCQLLQRITL
jgi:hypothetical protein